MKNETVWWLLAILGVAYYIKNQPNAGASTLNIPGVATVTIPGTLNGTPDRVVLPR